MKLYTILIYKDHFDTQNNDLQSYVKEFIGFSSGV